MYNHKSIRDGSIVEVKESTRYTYYKILQVGTRFAGLDSFIGLDLKDYPHKRVVNCESIEGVLVY